MRLTGRRESSNVEDRRGMSTGAKAGIGGGIGTIIVIALLTFMQGGNVGDVIDNVFQQSLQGSVQEQTGGGRTSFSEEEQQYAEFSKQILASLEDVWAKQFSEHGLTYEYPTMVLYSGTVQTACGQGSAQTGPFYCSGDEKLYLDLSFFSEMSKQLGINIHNRSSFAYAYVIAHEVGHHVEYLRGILGQCHAQMNRTDRITANKLSVRLELLADYYAGVWAHYEQEKYGSLEDGDLEEAIDAAQKIGDDYLQKRARGYSVPESFTHGTSKQRMKWLKLGYETGDWNTTTFDSDDVQL